MRLNEFALNENSARLDISATVKSVPGHERIFFEAYLNKDADTTPGWLRAVTKRQLVVEATCELRNGNECYIGHIQAHSQGKGYATEMLKYIIDFYNKKGIRKFSAYINHNNVNSQNLFRKAGFTETTKQRDGTYWTMNL